MRPTRNRLILWLLARDGGLVRTWSAGASIDGRVDFNNQLTLDRCFIEYENERVDFPMNGRWVFKDEFQLLLRLAGFVRWAHFGSPTGGQLDLGPDEQQSYWIVDKG